MIFVKLNNFFLKMIRIVSDWLEIKWKNRFGSNCLSNVFKYAIQAIAGIHKPSAFVKRPQICVYPVHLLPIKVQHQCTQVSYIWTGIIMLYAVLFDSLLFPVLSIAQLYWLASAFIRMDVCWFVCVGLINQQRGYSETT